MALKKAFHPCASPMLTLCPPYAHPMEIQIHLTSTHCSPTGDIQGIRKYMRTNFAWAQLLQNDFDIKLEQWQRSAWKARRTRPRPVIEDLETWRMNRLTGACRPLNTKERCYVYMRGVMKSQHVKVGRDTFRTRSADRHLTTCQRYMKAIFDTPVNGLNAHEDRSFILHPSYAHPMPTL